MAEKLILNPIDIASINYDSILENNTLEMEKAYNSTKFHEDK